jgi:glycerol-3-phosphate acyltransferase PlsY
MLRRRETSVAEVFTYVVSGFGIAVALLVLILHNRFLRSILGTALVAIEVHHRYSSEKISLVFFACSLIGVYAPSVGFYLWCVVLVWLLIAAVVYFRKLDDMHR